MFCKKCGKELEDNVRFCNYCGAEVESKHLFYFDTVRVKEDLRGGQAMESLGTEARGGQASALAKGATLASANFSFFSSERSLISVISSSWFTMVA